MQFRRECGGLLGGAPLSREGGGGGEGRVPDQVGDGDGEGGLGLGAGDRCRGRGSPIESGTGMGRRWDGMPLTEMVLGVLDLCSVGGLFDCFN